MMKIVVKERLLGVSGFSAMGFCCAAMRTACLLATLRILMYIAINTTNMRIPLVKVKRYVVKLFSPIRHIWRIGLNKLERRMNVLLISHLYSCPIWSNVKWSRVSECPSHLEG